MGAGDPDRDSSNRPFVCSGHMGEHGGCGRGLRFSRVGVATDRSLSITGRRFIVPVIVDEDYEGDPVATCRFQMTSGACTLVARRTVTRTRSCWPC